jgi:hypothetical protein
MRQKVLASETGEYRTKVFRYYLKNGRLRRERLEDTTKHRLGMRPFLASAETKNGTVSTVVFAESKDKAKRVANMCPDFKKVKYTDIRVSRKEVKLWEAEQITLKVPKRHPDRPYLDWNDPWDRYVLVKCGWQCDPAPNECKTCSARTICVDWHNAPSMRRQL